MGKNKADNIIINGRGRIYPDQVDAKKKYQEKLSKSIHAYFGNNWYTAHTEIYPSNKMPLATFTVTKDKRYRFRIASPGFTLCPIQISVEKHTITVIASDTGSVRPLKVQSLIIHPGERLVRASELNLWPVDL